MAAKKRKTQTLKEFQAWLEGVEELQPKTWAPTKEQWKLIRKRIDEIIPDAPTVARAVIPQLEGNTIPGYNPAPAPVSRIPEEAVHVKMSTAAESMLGPAGKTPEFVDASDGDISSPFA